MRFTLRILFTVVRILFGFVVLSNLVMAAPIQLQLIDVQKIWDEAPHNAFPDVVRFQNQWYVAFREADNHHVSGDGSLRIIRSPDGSAWESVAELDRNDEDMRGAHFTVLNDGRLMLLSAAVPLDSPTTPAVALLDQRRWQRLVGSTLRRRRVKLDDVERHSKSHKRALLQYRLRTNGKSFYHPLVQKQRRDQLPNACLPAYLAGKHQRGRHHLSPERHCRPPWCVAIIPTSAWWERPRATTRTGPSKP